MRELPAATLWAALARPSPRRKLAFCVRRSANSISRSLDLAGRLSLPGFGGLVFGLAVLWAGEKNRPGTPSAPDLCNPTAPCSAAEFNFLESSGQRYYYRHYNLARRVLSSRERASKMGPIASEPRTNRLRWSRAGALAGHGFEWGPGKPN